jgi:uncharacterized protein (DUF1697 family)
MRRYAAFLRGVMPWNARMPALKAAFESAGFTEVKTLLASGNVIFSSGAASITTLQQKAEAGMKRELGREFLTMIRSVEALQDLLESNPFGDYRLRPGSKRVVTFLREKPSGGLKLPAEMEGARILCVKGSEAFSAYVRGPKTPVFMTLIEKTFGKDVTTRTWETVIKAARL